ncbi:MAG: RhuM family protein, partial [Candidatus Firestonebacteria bacterium]
MKNNQPNSEIIIYQNEANAVKIDVRLEDDTVWLTQSQLVDLYQSSKANISGHIKHIFSDGELDEKVVVRKFRTTTKHGAIEGKTQTIGVNLYNLDMIISLGYRIKSRIATNFRIWATQRLNEYIRKGFTMNDDFLKESGGGKYWHELLDRIRDIRSSEKVLYRQVLDLYATSQDYDPKSTESIEFFKIVQNKLHYATHGYTAAEVIAERADAGKPFMGLLTFSKGGVAKKDIA